MVTGLEQRLPTDSTMPLTALSPPVASEYVTELLHDIRLAHRLARNVFPGRQRHQQDYCDRIDHEARSQPDASVYLRSPVPPAGVLSVS
ncbi:hypothetical protein P879_09562 [Paragonimus westermani]|uniref:Uncharacterized protein n=1 Tax=Paragonimus westermani TaxID=34504 RepID=A0A8T0D3F0_9TREM|nr:hypothetical protein P879_11873 [Paragonimus westermani]KAF8562671.1 hypothetical protein P879_09562 [Paragonimus westermani]